VCVCVLCVCRAGYACVSPQTGHKTSTDRYIRLGLGKHRFVRFAFTWRGIGALRLWQCIALPDWRLFRWPAPLYGVRPREKCTLKDQLGLVPGPKSKIGDGSHERTLVTLVTAVADFGFLFWFEP